MIRRLLVALLVCAALVGCKSNPLAGTWINNSKGGTIAAITFGNDGSFEVTNTASTSPAFSGTWDIKDDQINLNIDHSQGRELSQDQAQSLTAVMSSDSKQIAIGSQIFTKQ